MTRGRITDMAGWQRTAVMVEDDADIRRLLVIVLSSRGSLVHEPVTGAEGQRLVNEVRPPTSMKSCPRGRRLTPAPIAVPRGSLTPLGTVQPKRGPPWPIHDR